MYSSNFVVLTFRCQISVLPHGFAVLWGDIHVCLCDSVLTTIVVTLVASVVVVIVSFGRRLMEPRADG